MCTHSTPQRCRESAQRFSEECGGAAAVPPGKSFGNYKTEGPLRGMNVKAPYEGIERP